MGVCFDDDKQYKGRKVTAQKYFIMCLLTCNDKQIKTSVLEENVQSVIN